MADNLSKSKLAKRSRDDLEELEEKPLKLLKRSPESDDDGEADEEEVDEDEDEDEDEDDDCDADIKLEAESDAEEASLLVPHDLTSQLMATTLLLKNNPLFSNMAQSLIMQSTLMVNAISDRSLSAPS